MWIFLLLWHKLHHIHIQTHTHIHTHTHTSLPLLSLYDSVSQYCHYCNINFTRAHTTSPLSLAMIIVSIFLPLLYQLHAYKLKFLHTLTPCSHLSPSPPKSDHHTNMASVDHPARDWPHHQCAVHPPVVSCPGYGWDARQQSCGSSHPPSASWCGWPWAS